MKKKNYLKTMLVKLITLKQEDGDYMATDTPTTHEAVAFFN